MGVMACGRRGCPNIMCDRLIQNGDYESYICDACYGELCNQKDDWPNTMALGEVAERISEFMDSDREVIRGNIIVGRYEIDEEFKRLTREAYDGYDS